MMSSLKRRRVDNSSTNGPSTARQRIGPSPSTSRDMEDGHSSETSSSSSRDIVHKCGHDEIAACIDELWNVAGGLPLKEILLKAVKSDPSLGYELGKVMGQYQLNESIRKKGLPDMSFEPVADRMYTLLHKTYVSMSEVIQVGKAPEVCDQIYCEIDYIAKEASIKSASFDIRLSALNTLCMIGSTMCEGEHIFIREVRKHFQREKVLEDALRKIILSMTGRQCESVHVRKVSGKILVQHLMALEDSAKGYSLFPKLGEIINLL